MAVDWNRPILGVPLKYALPILGATVIGAGLFLWYRSRTSTPASSGKPGAPGGTPGASPQVVSGQGLGTVAYQVPTVQPARPSGGVWTTRGDTSYGTNMPIPVLNTTKVLADADAAADTITQIPENTPLNALGITVVSPTPVVGDYGSQGTRNYYMVSLPGGTTGYVLSQDINLAPNSGAPSAFFNGEPLGTGSNVFGTPGSYPYYV